ncbi:ABC transporter permease [Pseudarthrobacter oxydans]|uniref:ABC transporter permease n=1 Tax=Pseudarthrobacter oxydans TaxID=1671 RepID=UPI003825107C
MSTQKIASVGNSQNGNDRPSNAPETVNPRKNAVVRILKQGAIGWVLLALCVVAYIATPYFLTVDNMIIVARQTALVGIVAVGMTFVILTAGIDLSVGAVVGLTAVSVSYCLANGFGIGTALAAGVAVGLLVGALNGVGVNLAKVPPFIMTLGMMTIARGLALTMSNGKPIGVGAEAEIFSWIGAGDVLGIPVPVLIFAVVAGAAAFVLRYTSFGRAVYAVGDNREAARLSGIRVKRTLFIVYVIAGLLAALTGIIYVSRLTVGEPTAGMSLELDAIAIVVIGGTSLFGGQGKISGTIIGAAIVTVLSNLLDLLAVSSFTQQIIKGVIVIAAVILERVQNRHAND